MLPRRSPRSKKTGVQVAPVATLTTDSQALLSLSSSSSREHVNNISMPVARSAPASASAPSSQVTVSDTVVLGLYKIWHSGNTEIPFDQWMKELFGKPGSNEPKEVGLTEGASTTATDASTPEPLPSAASSPLTPTSELPDYFPSPSRENDPSNDSAQLVDAPVPQQVAVANAVALTQGAANANEPMLPDPTDGWAPLCWGHKFLEDREFKNKKQVWISYYAPLFDVPDA